MNFLKWVFFVFATLILFMLTVSLILKQTYNDGLTGNRNVAYWYKTLTKLNRNSNTTSTDDKIRLSTDFSNLNSRTLTCAKHTRVEILTPEDQLLIGNYVNFLVTTFDGQNKSRNVGGDFWFATLHDRQNISSTSGRINDLNNGSYVITFYLGSAGDMVIDLYLVYIAEALDFVREIYRPDENSFLWLGMYRRDYGPIVKSECRVRRGGPFDSKCEYGRGPKGMGNTVFVCEKSATHYCEELWSIESDHKMRAISDPVDRLLNENNFTKYFKSPFYNEKVPISINLNIQKSISNESTTPLPMTSCTSGFRSKRLPSNGYWVSGKWKSLECKTKTWSIYDLYNAFKGYEVYIIGDSTVKQWYVSLNNRMGRTELGDTSGRMHFKEIYEHFGFSFHFHYNRLPVALNKPVPIQHVMEKFEPELLDGLPCHSKCKYLIILGHWAHYGAWTEDTYRDHMFYIKEAVVRLIHRCNNVKVAIRSSHPRDQKYFQTRVQSNHWVFWDMNRIIREIYADVPVHFIDVWDLALSYPSVNEVHMPTECVNGMVDLLMSHIFSEQV